MKIAFVRHGDLRSSSFSDQCISASRALERAGFVGASVGLYSSKPDRAIETANFLSSINKFPEPVVHGLLELDDGENSGQPLKNALVGKGATQVFGDFPGGVVLVTHEPIIKTVTGAERARNGEVIFAEF